MLTGQQVAALIERLDAEAIDAARHVGQHMVAVAIKAAVKSGKPEDVAAAVAHEAQHYDYAGLIAAA